MDYVTKNFLQVPTPEGVSMIRPSTIVAIFPYEDGINPLAKSWIKIEGGSQIKVYKNTLEIKELLEEF